MQSFCEQYEQPANSRQARCRQVHKQGYRGKSFVALLMNLPTLYAWGRKKSIISLSFFRNGDISILRT